MRYLRPAFLALLVVTLILSGAVYAQDGAPYTIGILLTNELDLLPAYDGFLEAMVELGYVEDESVRYVYFDALTHPDVDEAAVAELAAQLEDAAVDLLLVSVDWDAEVVDELTDDIPIVVCFSEDLVGVGLAESLTEPGGNVTGIHNADYHARGLQILLEINPAIAKVYFPYTDGRRESLAILDSLLAMAEDLEIELVAEGVADETIFQQVSNMPDDIDAIYLPPDPFTLRTDVFLVILQGSIQRKAALVIPAAVPSPGVLMGYGPDTFVNGRQAAGIVDRILRGADPGLMPLENAELFLMVNLQSAAFLGLEVPRSVLRQAEMIFRPGDLDDFELPGAATGDEATEDD